MKKLFIFLLCICSNTLLFAQKEFFIYLQSANDKPFYLKMMDKIYSSTASGYLILSNLADSTYSFSIGQVGGSSLTESQYIIKLNNKDKGFLLKQFQSGLGLFDLQTLSVTMPVDSNKGSQTTSAVVKKDPFSTLLAQAANDSSLLMASVSVAAPSTVNAVIKEKVKEATVSEKVVVEVPEKKEVLVEPVKEKIIEDSAALQSESKVNSTKEENVVVANTETEKVESKLPEVNTAAEETFFKRSNVMKRSESSTTEGFGLVYLDNINGTVDTIRIIIPNPKNYGQTTETTDVSSDKRFLDISNNKNEEKKKVVSPNQNQKCKNVATENDFYKVRKNMAAEDSEEKMIVEAKKHFSKRCYTTEQIRSLSALFLQAENKYEFIAAAFSFVADVENFGTMEKELISNELKIRFKKLIDN